jgi:DNA topoisomerase-2
VAQLEQQAGEHGCNGLEKMLKLYTTKSITNMHAFDENEKLVKFATVAEILTHFERVRLETYVKRKTCQLALLQKDALVLENKARFISALLDNQLDLRKKTSTEVNQLLRLANFLVVDDSFHYLVHMPMNSTTQENVDKLLAERDAKNSELATLHALSPAELWLQELQVLRVQYVKKMTKVTATSAKAAATSAKATTAKAAPIKRKFKIIAKE